MKGKYNTRAASPRDVIAVLNNKCMILVNIIFLSCSCLRGLVCVILMASSSELHPSAEGVCWLVGRSPSLCVSLFRMDILNAALIVFRY